jgi:iron complex transport system ATP-binding protein
LDEPTAFLDVTSRIETMTLLRRLAVEQKKAILLSTHDMDIAIQMSDRLCLLGKDRPIACGAPEDLILSGSFASFFNKESIVFDLSSGKLTSTKPLTPIAVEGDVDTVYWVSNALVRNGFRSSAIKESPFRIHCYDPNHFSLFLPGSPEIKVFSISELIHWVTNYC